MLSIQLFLAKKDFEKNHPSPEVISLDSDTIVTNKGNTSNRHPNGNFGNSWMKYWMTFSCKTSGFVCSIDGEPIWVEGDQDSENACRENNRMFEIMYHPHIEKAEEAYNGREAHGAHIQYNGKTYIVPMCAQHNTEYGDSEVEITLKAGTILVEEVAPIIDKD